MAPIRFSGAGGIPLAKSTESQRVPSSDAMSSKKLAPGKPTLNDASVAASWYTTVALLVGVCVILLALLAVFGAVSRAAVNAAESVGSVILETTSKQGNDSATGPRPMRSNVAPPSLESATQATQVAPAAPSAQGAPDMRTQALVLFSAAAASTATVLSARPFSRLYASVLPTKYVPSPLGPGVNGTAVLRKQPTYPGSLGEAVLMLAPYCLSSSGKERTSVVSHRDCASWDRSTVFSDKQCRDWLTLVHGRSIFDYLAIKRGSALPYGESVRMAGGSVIIIKLHSRDINVCHFTMRVLLAYDVLRRGNSVFGDELTNVSAVVVVASNNLQPALKPSGNGHLPYHAGLLNALFVRHGIPVFTPTSLSKLVGSGDKSSSSNRNDAEALCFPSTAQIGSHANRFSFKDSELPAKAALEGEVPLQLPLSSDAFAFRRAVFASRKPPAMRNKICYIARWIGRKRSFSQEAETTFRSILRSVALKTDASVSIFEAKDQRRPSTVRSFKHDVVPDICFLVQALSAHQFGFVIL
jgi:hypothetical protein